MADSADNTLMLEILKDIKKEQNNHRTLLLQTVDAVRTLQRYTEEKFLNMEERFLNMEKHMKAHKDDLELMLKSELLGSMAHFPDEDRELLRAALGGEGRVISCAYGSLRRQRLAEPEATPWT